ncbi:hypothetical protein SKTS_25470 [Sulfurimicrobium lacus]|uniref:Cache domain-containing protein n=1 Tax=Sulfurimicrobium lacus TaxID=2715678 RepID=A0A6F8VER0_9PROT|nr:hypothetical protein [Sulfurimicrobium lacus]BCB27661.1 hypothetical protein SKTS_25470 [Sulfurimicrobium lacus]
MQLPKENLQESIAHQREALIGLLQEPMQQLADKCSREWGERTRLDELLRDALKNLPYCKHLYALDSHAVQISDNVSHDGLQDGYGRDRSDRPYMGDIARGDALYLSDAYISLRERRPSLTALQIVRDEAGNALGYIGAYFGLRDLPLTRKLYEEPRYWRQIKGDPSIRGTVFHQTRADSEMDRHIDTVMGVVAELMLYQGVFHVMLHFSSSRAVVWVMEDPYRYRLLDIKELIDPDTCLAYPRTPYPSNALIPAEKIRTVLESFRALRLMDEMFYLRSATLNIFNGIVGLTFSCDGSHYIPYDEFLAMDNEFWMGGE